MNSARSDDDSSSTEARRRGAGILDRLRATRGPTNTKQKDRVALLDALQNIRLRANGNVYARRDSDRDDRTALTTESPSTASTPTSTFNWQGAFNPRNNCQMGLHQHALPVLSSTFTESKKPSTSEDSTTWKRHSKISTDLRNTRIRSDSRWNSSLSPLYRAVSAGAPRHVVEDLLHEHHSGPSQPSNGGLAPLHCAIERYDTQIDVLILLLASNPSAAGSRCANGYNCVDLLWKRFVEPDDYRSETTKEKAAILRRSMEDVVSSKFAMHRQARAKHALQESGDLNEFWSTVVTFIRAACHGSTSQSSSAKLVHDCVEIDCHPLLISFAAARYPDEIREYVDNEQRLPLHLAATISPRATKAVLALYRQAASQTDASGRIPLHYAIEHGMVWTDGIQELTMAAPKCFTLPDPKTGLFPCLAAACIDSPDLTTIFCLVSANPTDLMNYALQSYL